jgi:predicted nucleic acid-binding protein
MAWCFVDESSPFVERCLDALKTSEALVPWLWCAEIANVLANAERRNRITPTNSDEYIQFLDGLDFEVDAGGAQRLFTHVLPLARSQRLSAYDAAYLELAIRAKAALATKDQGLRRAAGNTGVPLLE